MNSFNLVKRFSLCCAAVVALLVLFAGSSAAQTNQGQISGNVLDSTGAQVPNAKISAKNEATGSTYHLPEKGLLGRHALFDPGVLDRPALDEFFHAQKRDGQWKVQVKREGMVGTITYPFNPLDAIGWKGDLYPLRLNIRDFRPVSSARVHLPPSVFTSFVADGFGAFAQAYAARDALAGRPVRVQASDGAHAGIAEGVDERGALRVRHAATLAVYDSADVSVRAA